MISQLNVEAFRLINDVGKEFPELNGMVVFVAEYTLYILLLSMLGYWFTRTTQNRMMMIQAIGALVIAEVLAKLSGLFYSHYQPFATLANVNQLIEHSVDNSFPSDHTIIFFTISFSIFLIHRKSGFIWLILACSVGISRIWVGVHYPIDVAVGALYGILSATFVYWIASKVSIFHRVLEGYERIEQRILPSKKSKDRQ